MPKFAIQRKADGLYWLGAAIFTEKLSDARIFAFRGVAESVGSIECRALPQEWRVVELKPELA